MLYNTKNRNEIKWLQDLGIEVNPYEIIDGELISSDGNLLLMDSEGTVTIPSRVTKIGNGAYRDLEGLKTIIIPGTVKEIGDYAFSGNSTLENVIIQEGVEKIGEFAFEDCVSLKEIRLPNSITTVGSSCFLKCSSLTTASLSSSLKSIPYRLFYNCSNLEEIEIPEGVNKIDSDAFFVCHKISSIKIPASVTSIAGGAFTNMQGLTNIEIDPMNMNYTFHDGLLLSKDETRLYNVLYNLTDIKIPDTVITLEGLSRNLKKISIPKSVTTINTTLPSSLQEIEVEEGNLNFASDNGNLYDAKMETLIKYCSNEATIDLPQTVKVIKSRAFGGKSAATTLNLPEGLEIIGYFAFSGLTNVRSLNLPQSVTSITTSSFSDTNINNLTIDEGNPKYKCEDGIYILSKDGKMLYAISRLQLGNYTIPETVEIIKSTSFYTTNVKSIVIPNNVKEIEGAAFDWAAQMQRIEIPASIEKIGTTAFSRCDSLKEIVIHKPKDSVAGAPWGCPYGLRAVKWYN